MLPEVNFSKSHGLVIHLSSGILFSVSTHTRFWSIVHKVYSIICLQWLISYNNNKVQTAHHDLSNTTTPGLFWVPIPVSPAVPLVCYAETTLVFLATPSSKAHALGHGLPSTWNACSSYSHRALLSRSLLWHPNAFSFTFSHSLPTNNTCQDPR